MSSCKGSKRKALRYSTSAVAVKLYGNLLRDFRNSEGSGFCRDFEHVLLEDISKFRKLESSDSVYEGAASVRYVKRKLQMDALLKKFRFENDAYDDDELSERTFNKFYAEQVRLHKPMPLKLSGYKVLQRARIIARGILGDVPCDEVISNFRFGKKSSIGCPLRLAYIDVKLLCKRAFTGTSETWTAFKNLVLPGDRILRRILRNHDFNALGKQLKTAYLNLVEVPKTWKAYRLMTPLTLIGLFISYGVGRVVQGKLKQAGLDINKLQAVHRNLVKGFSVTCSHATADLSSASDSITSELLNRVLPRAWYRLLRLCFVRELHWKKRSFSTASVLPMGNGCTFPVETLVFYCIIKAIGELTNTKGIYSVYGDDLIYPRKIHRYVAEIFPQLHLKLNTEKTFCERPFRESCGSDYYRGQDVRPYFLKGEAQHLTRVRYEAFLYKVYNGLTARWDPLEIRETLTWLLTELAMVSRGILRVPPSYPDYSGVKVDHPNDVPLDYNLLPFNPVNLVGRALRPGEVAGLKGEPYGSRWFLFDYLTETSKKRVVISTMPYYWLALQGLNDNVVVDGYKTKLNEVFFEDFNRVVHRNMRGKRNRALRWLRTIKENTGSLVWRKTPLPSKVFYQKGKKVVKKRTKYTALTASRSGAVVSKATTKTDTISDWI